MAKDRIVIKGAQEHNLKNIDLEIPRDKFVVITGLSGSGKSSWPLIPFMLKGKGVMWNPFLLTPGNSWARWKTKSRLYRGFVSSYFY